MSAKLIVIILYLYIYIYKIVLLRTLNICNVTVSDISMTLYAKQKERHRRIEQTFGLCGRRQGWDVLKEQH